MTARAISLRRRETRLTAIVPLPRAARSRFAQCDQAVSFGRRQNKLERLRPSDADRAVRTLGLSRTSLSIAVVRVQPSVDELADLREVV